jgi:hypothetical protein
MSLRIACDLDGTLADMDAALQREAERLFGPGVSLRGASLPEADETGRLKPAATPSGDDELPRVTGLTDPEMRRLWKEVRGLENFWMTLPEIEPGAVARLFALSTLHGWEMLFLTRRPATAGDTAQVQTQRWLEAHGFALPSVYVMSGSRGKVTDALALDALIDDRPENCLDVITDSKARALLVWRDAPHAVPPAAARLGIETVSSMADALELLQQPAHAARPGGLVGRLRSAIGI